jgi:hypothetical protein
MGLISLIP